MFDIYGIWEVLLSPNYESNYSYDQDEGFRRTESHGGKITFGLSWKTFRILQKSWTSNYYSVQKDVVIICLKLCLIWLMKSYQLILPNLRSWYQSWQILKFPTRRWYWSSLSRSWDKSPLFSESSSWRKRLQVFGPTNAENKPRLCNIFERYCGTIW